MLQAMRMFFGGTLPGGRVAPDDTPFVSQSPMAIAPLHTMTGSGTMAHGAHRKDVTASLQNLKVACHTAALWLCTPSQTLLFLPGSV